MCRSRLLLAPAAHRPPAAAHIQRGEYDPALDYNGGPLRQPTQRIHDPQMNALRKGLIDAGLAPSMDPFREFFTGRNPM